VLRTCLRQRPEGSCSQQALQAQFSSPARVSRTHNRVTLDTYELPAAIASYFAARDGADAEGMLGCFAENAAVWDIGEDLVLRGTESIRHWLTSTVAGYELSYQVVSSERCGDEYLVGVVVSGKFPGSPYKFENRFKLQGDLIAELKIEPIGSLAE
jgi:hypothetical protein